MKKRERPSTLLLFLIYPFLGFILAIKDLKRWTNGIVFVLFSALWGYCMTFSYTASDCYRLAAVFCQRPFHRFQSVLNAYDDGKLVDLYLSIMNWFVHQFSANVKVFFCALGFVFGLCCYVTIRELLDSRKNYNDQYLKLIILLLFSTASFGHLAMPRFWTAAWLSAFLMIKLMKKKYHWLPLVAALPMIHYGFVPVVAVLLASIIFSNFFTKHENVLMGLVITCFILSFVLNSQILSYVIPDSWVSGEKASYKYRDYVDSGISSGHNVIKQRSAYRQTNRFVTKLFQLLMKMAALFVMCVIHNHKEWIKKDKDLWNCYIFILLMSCVCFFMGVLSGVGWRYVWFLWMPLYYLLYRIYDNNRNFQIRKLIIALIPINIYTIAFMFYVSYKNVDLGLLWMPLYNLIVKGFDFPPVYFV